MLIKGWLVGEWGRTAAEPPRALLPATAAGRRQLEREVDDYRRVAQAIALILQPS